MLPVVLHTLAFLVCLCVQSMASPLAGTWLFPHLAGCAVLLSNGKYPEYKGIVWYFSLAWLFMLFMTTFILAPISGSGSFMWILVAMPSLALCLRKEHLRPYCICFMGCIILYASGLIYQEIVHMQYTTYNVDDRRSWPLMDPNNGAAVINMALLPCVWMALFKDVRWALLALFFAAALYLTGSQAGAFACAAGIFMLTVARFGTGYMLGCLLAGIAEGIAIFLYRPDWIVKFIDRFAMRFPIWEASMPLVYVRPWTGLGFGSFGYYYVHLRTENYTQGWHSHNDLLQFAIEMGIPGMLVFAGLMLSVAWMTCRANLVSSCVIFVVFIQSMVEFQFYIPAISLPMGLALAYTILNSRKPDPFR